MTYCLAIQVDAGVVFAADSRTNAGLDYVTTYSKLHCFSTDGENGIALLSSGNLATTQEVLSWIERDLQQNAAENLSRYSRMFELAAYVGRVSQAVQGTHRTGLQATGVNGQGSFILGGQVRGEAPSIYLVYPEGNFIRASADTPYLQIGETKYGKPILDRLVAPTLSLEQAARLAVLSLNATIKSNVTVGTPIDLGVYRRDSFRAPSRRRLHSSDAYYIAVSDGWDAGLKDVFMRLPDFEWKEPS